MQCAITAQASNYTQVIEAPPLPLNTWTHVAVALDGRQGILYVNGKAVAVNNSINLLPSDLGATKNYFGKSQFAADAYFNGQLDSVKINSRTLTRSRHLPFPLLNPLWARSTLAETTSRSPAGPRIIPMRSCRPRHSPGRENFITTDLLMRFSAR